MVDKAHKRKSEGIRRRKKTVIRNIYKLGNCPGIDVAFTICQNGKYTTYKSVDKPDFPPSTEQLVGILLGLSNKSR
jgi:hypothetical protein